MRSGSSFLLIAALFGLTACTRSPAGHIGRADSTNARESIGIVQAGLTDQYVRLLRARLSAEDPYRATVPIHCEQRRIIRLLTNRARDPLEGQNNAVRLLRAAERRAFSPADEPDVDRVDRALAGRVFDGRVNCDSVARTGVLGDTVILPPKPGRF